eukprot:m.208618 g.208618  ORF g.208618 m.208618 type:complete len:60 (+) comp39712_c2_seq18:1361-1540(+)
MFLFKSDKTLETMKHVKRVSFFDAWLDSPLIKEPTVEMLLKACEDAGIAERVVKENYKP